MHRDTLLLIAARSVRSIGQGALVVDFSLYLHALGWSAGSIGAVLAAALMIGAGLTLLVGPMSDRIGRRRLIVLYEVVQAIAAAAAFASSDPRILVPAAIVGGFGRGANGAAGPFGPVEQAWLAHRLTPGDRGPVLGLNAGAGFFGMGLGAFIAMMPAYLTPWLPGAAAFRPLFLIVLAGSVVCLGLVMRIGDEPRRPVRHAATAEAAPDACDDATRTREENRLMTRVVLVNALNGIGMGLVGPLMAYWFELRFGQGPQPLGAMMAIGFLLSGVASIGVGQISRRLGLVRSVVITRFAGLLLMIALPFAPTFGIAAAIYLLRALFNRGTAGPRQALYVSLVRRRRRGLVASLGNVSQQIPRAIGPAIAGVMFDAGMFVLPFLIAAGFQIAFLFAYDRSFRAQDPVTAVLKRYGEE
jgi:MFS family permease